MLLHPRDFPGKSTGVGCHFLLQRIFLTQGSKPGLPHCGQMLYHLSHQGSPNRNMDIYIYIYIFFFSIAWGDCLKKIWLRFMSKNRLPVFFSRSFMVSYLIYKSLSHFASFLCMVWGCGMWIFLKFRVGSTLPSFYVHGGVSVNLSPPHHHCHQLPTLLHWSSLSCCVRHLAQTP